MNLSPPFAISARLTPALKIAELCPHGWRADFS